MDARITFQAGVESVASSRRRNTDCAEHGAGWCGESEAMVVAEMALGDDRGQEEERAPGLAGASVADKEGSKPCPRCMAPANAECQDDTVSLSCGNPKGKSIRDGKDMECIATVYIGQDTILAHRQKSDRTNVPSACPVCLAVLAGAADEAWEG